jgi:adenylate cyclase
MLQRLAGRLLDLVARVGTDPSDSAELRVRKGLLVLFSIVVLPAGIIWAGLYWVNGETTAALLPLAFSVISVVAIVVFHQTHDFTVLRRTELVGILVTPFVLGVVLGGLVASSGVVLWSFLAPLGAIAFVSPRRAWRWFGAFLLLVMITTPLAAIVRPHPEPGLPSTMILVFMALNIGAVAFFAFLLLATFARQRQDAQERADDLLLNILPASVAERLKADRSQIAEHHDDVSVLFADVVDFTPMAAELAPAEVVGLLDGLFTDFDELADRYGVEKIKTVGDAYMVAAGVPSPRADHAPVMAQLALEMCSLAANHDRNDGTAVRLRIGIASGPVVAGVIGRRKFIYDLWGDTVNVASRMESHGTPGRIQVAETTYELIKDAFVLEPRGMVEIKGRGAIPTWYLVGPADRAAEPV